jgi:hypothetical protein
MLDYPEQRHRKSQAQQKPDELFDRFFRLKRFGRQEKQKRIRAPSQQLDFCQIWIDRSAGGVLNKRYTSQSKHWDKQPIPEKLHSSADTHKHGPEHKQQRGSNLQDCVPPIFHASEREHGKCG